MANVRTEAFFNLMIPLLLNGSLIPAAVCRGMGLMIESGSYTHTNVRDVVFDIYVCETFTRIHFSSTGIQSIM